MKTMTTTETNEMDLSGRDALDAIEIVLSGKPAKKSFERTDAGRHFGWAAKCASKSK